MDNEVFMEYLKIFITIFIALSGWVVAHYFTSRRGLENKKRETKINLIVKSYESISCWMSEPTGGDALKGLVNALILVQCYGSQNQLVMARKSLKSIADNDGSVEGLGDLISSLRDDFRNEIGLPKDGESVAIVRK
jgi:hypothetical protein